MRVFGANSESQLIGISGTFGSGKDTAAMHLAVHRGFMHVSTGDVCRAEATRQGRDHDRSTLADIAAELRRFYGSLGALIIKGVEQWEERRSNFSGGLVISGLRVVGDAEELRNQNGRLIYIDAPSTERYARVLRRAEAGRTADLVNIHSLEDFIESEQAELKGLGGPEFPHLEAMEATADVVIQNTGPIDELRHRIDQIIGYTLL